MSSNSDPQQIINELLNSGKITQAQLEQAKMLANQMKNLKN
jgi:hypothetical protein